MPAYCADRISPHLSYTPEGYLIAKDVPIARTGWLRYRGSEIGLDTDELIDVYRNGAELFSAKTIASCEGKPITNQHPGSFVKPSNVGWYARGHMQNVRKGPVLADGERALIADLVIMDEALIEQVEQGHLRECSLGYDCEYHPQADNSWLQKALLVNHIAVVPSGRAGTNVRILDSVKGDTMAVSMADVNARLDQLITICEQAITKNTKKRTTQDTLADEINEIVAASQRTERLVRSGAGPQAFATAYEQYSADQDRAREFEQQTRAAGKAMQKRFLPKSCTQDAAPVRQHQDAGDWADEVNRRGRELRGR